MSLVLCVVSPLGERYAYFLIQNSIGSKIKMKLKNIFICLGVAVVVLGLATCGYKMYKGSDYTAYLIDVHNVKNAVIDTKTISNEKVSVKYFKSKKNLLVNLNNYVGNEDTVCVGKIDDLLSGDVVGVLIQNINLFERVLNYYSAIIEHDNEVANHDDSNGTKGHIQGVRYSEKIKKLDTGESLAYVNDIGACSAMIKKFLSTL
ncbi:hypothetical protein JG666_18875 [Vibrio cholerae]|nr:hypothetical protein [Vibrio cholerae]